MSLRVVLVRHAEGTHQRPGIVVGRQDAAELTAAGVVQGAAAARCRFLAGATHVCTSSAVRARRTAELALGDHHPALLAMMEVREDLVEQSQGEWEGARREAVHTPAVCALRDAQTAHFRAPGGESMAEVGQRMQSWVAPHLLCSESGEARHVVCFTHAMSIRCFAAAALGWPFDALWCHALENTGVVVLDKPRGQPWRLVAWNDTAHCHA